MLYTNAKLGRIEYYNILFYFPTRNEEMVMPAERVGAVRDAYLWRVLQRRGAESSARYLSAPAQAPYQRLFTEACPSTVSGVLDFASLIFFSQHANIEKSRLYTVVLSSSET